jgi:hypothetical protein
MLNEGRRGSVILCDLMTHSSASNWNKAFGLSLPMVTPGAISRFWRS